MPVWHRTQDPSINGPTPDMPFLCFLAAAILSSVRFNAAGHFSKLLPSAFRQQQ
jgi:hypothetical protein